MTRCGKRSRPCSANFSKKPVRASQALIERMKSVREGERTLLDNAMVLLGNGNGDGARHNHDDLAIVLAGRGGGTIDPGRHVRYAPGTQFMNLVVCVLDRMGVELDRFGDSTGRLPGLTT
ncbi:MAG TPA: hypothetical protein VJ783_09380 [Pirellulales bacterium]|nr:hypothetical protein [Pirellulales bacterium]